MKPFKKRIPDRQYRELLEDTVYRCTPVMSQQDEMQYRVMGSMMRFNFENGFPLMTERDISEHLGQAFGELCGFLNGAQTLQELGTFGNFWWKRWATAKKCLKRGLPEGDLGPGSYGAAWRRFPTAEGKPFDQITNLIEQMKELPHLLTHFVSPWVPQYTFRGEGKQQKVVVVPCHGWFHVILDPRYRELHLISWQRSADVPVGLVFDIAMYGALAMMLAQVIGYTAKELVYQISCPHIFERQKEAVEELLSRDPRRFPTLTLDPSITNIFDFRKEHFMLSDYDPHPAMKVLTPV